MTYRCCGRYLSTTGERLLKWGWFSTIIMLVILGSVMFAVGDTQSDDGLLVGGLICLVVSVVDGILWIGYVCNVCGWRDEGCDCYGRDAGYGSL